MDNPFYILYNYKTRFFPLKIKYRLYFIFINAYFCQ
jgi:hypothetical protein